MPDTLSCNLCLREGTRDFELHFDHGPFRRCGSRAACLKRRRLIALFAPEKLISGLPIRAIREIVDGGQRSLAVVLPRGLTVIMQGQAGVNWWLRVEDF